MYATMKRVLAIGGLLLFCQGAHAGLFFVSGSPLDPVDPEEDGETTASLQALDFGLITDLNVSIELAESGSDDPENYWDDLTMVIEHNGIFVVLNDALDPECCDRNGLFDVTFDDEAAAPIDDFSEDAVGTFQPEDGLLSMFDGSELNGIWNLIFFENCCEDESRLVSWSISGTVADASQVPEPGTLGLVGVGLLALGFTRRRRAA